MKEHKLAFGAALIVGLIYIAPNIFFIFSLGDAYKGIPMQVADEDFYLARIQEILDNYPLVGSVALFEYKNQMPLSPPGGEFIYALPSLIFNVAPVNTIVLSRFFLPFILFLLVYCLVLKLTKHTDYLSSNVHSWQGASYGEQKINAVATALFVTLGYAFTDYQSIFKYLKGISAPGDFLIWTRPVNPILGAIFLMSFLIFLWFIAQKRDINSARSSAIFQNSILFKSESALRLPKFSTQIALKTYNGAKQQKVYIVGASLFLVLMISNYFFSWGLAISIAAALILIYLFKKEYKTAKNLIIAVFLGLLLSAPYWYGVFRASQSPWYEESLPRKGLFYTHYPLFNKVMLTTLAVYLFCVFLPIFIGRLKGKKIIIHFKNWHWFCLALILGSLWAYMQQIITGMTIWPYHFAQYSIPLALIVLMVLFFNVIKDKFRFLWKAGIFVIIAASLFLGIYIQASAYKQLYPYYSNLQSYTSLLDWINRREKDCVILAKVEDLKFNNLILAFTHCDIYDANGYFSITPGERIYHNYLVRMLFDGATSQNVDKYLKESKIARHYLFSNWKELFQIKDFSDVPNNLEEKLKKVPEDYIKFFAKDLKSELKKYKLDYIFIGGELTEKAADLIKELDLVYVSDGISVYKF